MTWSEVWPNRSQRQRRRFDRSMSPMPATTTPMTTMLAPAAVAAAAAAADVAIGVLTLGEVVAVVAVGWCQAIGAANRMMNAKLAPKALGVAATVATAAFGSWVNIRWGCVAFWAVPSTRNATWADGC